MPPTRRYQATGVAVDAVTASSLPHDPRAWRGHAEPVRCAYGDVEYLPPDEDPDRTWASLAVREHGGPIEVWQRFGDEGMRPEVLTAVGRDGAEVLSVCDAEAGGTAFAYAADGRVLAEASSLAPGDLDGADPDRVRSTRAGTDVDGLTSTGCLSLAEDMIGVVLVELDGDETVLGVLVEPYPRVRPPRAGPSQV